MALTGLEWLAAGALAGTLGGGVHSGMQANRQQKRALRDQQQAQQQAETLAQRQMRENAEALAKTNRKRPDVTSLLGEAQSASRQGIGSTLLTGSGTADNERRLGRSSLLGG